MVPFSSEKGMATKTNEEEPHGYLGVAVKSLQYVQVLAATCAVAFATGCAPTHYVTTESPAYDPHVSARVRILSGNDQQSATLRHGACYTSVWQSDPERIQVDDSFLAHYRYSSRSVVIGMPPSPRPWMRVEGLQFKDMVREYVVYGGSPLTLWMTAAGDTGGGRFGYSWSCTPSAMTFTPVAGEDYDVYMSLGREGKNSRYCAITIHRIDGNGLDEPVDASYAPKCPASAGAKAPTH